jgi:hypothetical protein
VKSGAGFPTFTIACFASFTFDSVDGTISRAGFLIGGLWHPGLNSSGKRNLLID